MEYFLSATLVYTKLPLILYNGRYPDIPAHTFPAVLYYAIYWNYAANCKYLFHTMEIVSELLDECKA